MSPFYRAATMFDRLGARAGRPRGECRYGRRTPGMVCSVDPSVRWVNTQAKATAVSPVIRTTPYAEYRA